MKHLFAFLFFTTITSIAFSQITPVKTINGYKVISPEKTAALSVATSPNAPQDLPVTYTFTGNGNWNNPANWQNNLVPPQPTNLGSQIIINNISPGQCLLNIPYTVTPGTDLIILTGKSLVVPLTFDIN